MSKASKRIPIMIRSEPKDVRDIDFAAKHFPLPGGTSRSAIIRLALSRFFESPPEWLADAVTKRDAVNQTRRRRRRAKS